MLEALEVDIFQYSYPAKIKEIIAKTSRDFQGYREALNSDIKIWEDWINIKLELNKRGTNA